MNEKTKLVLIVGVIVLAGMVINNSFILLTPVPESPVMARASAAIALQQAAADIQNQHIYTTYLVAIGVIIAGLFLCFGALWLALKTIQAVGRGLIPQALPEPRQQINPYALEVRHEKF